MKNILFLKIVIVTLTLLIFLTLGGIMYAIINYKTTPKLLKKNKTEISNPIKETKDKGNILSLSKDEKIIKSFACGEMLCLHITTPFDNERIVVVNPENLKKQSVLKITKENK